jgi:Lrp/AsnC family transcriptional regulator
VLETHAAARGRRRHHQEGRADRAGTVGLGITVFVSIETGDHSNEWLRKFAEVVSAMPEVMEFYRMAGDVDYMLRVVVTDIAGYDAFYKKLIATVPLKNVTSRFAMERIKSTTALPIVEPRANA